MIAAYAILLVTGAMLLASVALNVRQARALQNLGERRTQRAMDRELVIDDLRAEVRALRSRVMIDEVFGGRRDV